MDPNEELVMIESRHGFFESIRHTLVGLQHVLSVDTRFDKYLVNGSLADDDTQHIRENPRVNLMPLVHHITADGLKRGDVRQYQNYDILKGMPKDIGELTSLDSTQLKAVHRILAKEIALVQGPPGTGKTFTSVQALKCLALSQKPQKVIVVSAETNHAIDQILAHLVRARYNVLRLGGRSQDEEIKKLNLFHLRRHCRSQSKAADLEQSRQRLIKQFHGLVANAFPDDQLLDPGILLQHGIITEEQLGSLVDEKTNWVPPQGRPGGVMSEWLKDALVDVSIRMSEDPVFDSEEVDLGDGEFDIDEFEPDLDDPAVDDDTTSRLSGKWVKISRKWGGANPKGYTEKNVLIRRQLQKQDLWQVDQKFRGAIYEFWWGRLHTVVCNNLQAVLGSYISICKDIKVNGWMRDVNCIKTSNIHFVGCTTTGLSKYRGLLAALKPTTLLIEEAALSREANITAALFPSLQRLVLVGDHQQLRPHCEIPTLGEAPYNITVSMFERLVKHLGLPYTLLKMQRRSIPAIRELLNPFYPQLQDHSVVVDPKNRPTVPGVAAPSYLFHHTWPEDLQKESLSRYNLREAEMIIRFAIHLMLNGVPSHEITILTFYRGQRKKISSLSREHVLPIFPEASLNVQTVDSYQGEENDIIILSLVRSNRPNGPNVAGFVEDMSRGVVSISRARRGFYLFGNIVNLENATGVSAFMWGSVRQVFERQGRYNVSRRGIPLRCSNHGTVIYAEDADDLANIHGGCLKKCEGLFKDCGHRCTRLCHPMPHDKLICEHACEQKLHCGHGCANVCGQYCSCERSCREFSRRVLELSISVQTNEPRQPRQQRPRLVQPNSISKGSAVRNDWADFNAAQDDARARQVPNKPELLIDISEPAATPSNLKDVYRPVKVDSQGRREIGPGEEVHEYGGVQNMHSRRDRANNSLTHDVKTDRKAVRSDGSSPRIRAVLVARQSVPTTGKHASHMAGGDSASIAEWECSSSSSSEEEETSGTSLAPSLRGDKSGDEEEGGNLLIVFD